LVCLDSRCEPWLAGGHDRQAARARPDRFLARLAHTGYVRPVEAINAHGGLELTHLDAEHLLGDVQAPRCRREAGLLGNSHKVAQVRECQAPGG
jgi:hypothetical protein